MNISYVLIMFIGLYILFGAILFGILSISILKKNKRRISGSIFSIAITTESGKRYEGMQALMLFIFKWPEVFSMVTNYIMS